MLYSPLKVTEAERSASSDRQTSRLQDAITQRRQEARANGISVEEFVAQEAEKGEMKVTTNKKKESTIEEMGVTVEQVMKAMQAIEAAKAKV